jgi:hypothetical protein
LKSTPEWVGAVLGPAGAKRKHHCETYGKQSDGISFHYFSFFIDQRVLFETFACSSTNYATGFSTANPYPWPQGQVLPLQKFCVIWNISPGQIDVATEMVSGVAHQDAIDRH